MAASAGGDSQVLTAPDHVHVINPEGGFCAECGDHEAHEVETHGLTQGDIGDLLNEMSGFKKSLGRIESALALLAAEALTDVPVPSDSDAE